MSARNSEMIHKSEIMLRSDSLGPEVEVENQDIYRKNSALFVKSDEDINDRNFSDVEMESPNFNKESTPLKAAMDYYSSPTVKRP